MKEVPPANLPYDYRNPTQSHVPPPALPRYEPAPPAARPALSRPAPKTTVLRKTKRRLAFIVERTRTGYSAYCATGGIATVGRTVAELKANVVEAVNLQYAPEGLVYALPDVKITPDLPQFFDFYRALNPELLAVRLGMSPGVLSQLASGRRKPTPQQAARVLSGLQALGRELAELEPL